MNKTVGILTYHGLHNYGAMLQAFALQKTIQSLNLNCEIINFRTKIQENRYRTVFKTGSSVLEGLAKMLFWVHIKSDIQKKHKLFETFAGKELNLTKNKYSTLKELEDNLPQFNYYITGSDQVWNPYGPSFNWAYFLPFPNLKGQRISYAPSMGNLAIDDIDFETKNRIKSYVKNFEKISVRETTAANNIEIITGEKPEVVLDPTLLINKSQWEKYIDPKKIIEEDYIFYYSPYYNKNALNVTRRISQKLKLKVVTSIAHSASFMIKYPDFKKITAVGPLEFVNLCNNAKLICGHSLHQVALSISLQKPFYITDGLTNKRTNHLLTITELQNRNISMHEIDNKINSAFDIDYKKVNKLIEAYKKTSLKFLEESLR